jgi:hypothetical protein
LVQEKKHTNWPDKGGPAVRTNLTEAVRGIIFVLVTDNSPVVVAGNSTAVGLGEEGTGGDDEA